MQLDTSNTFLSFELTEDEQLAVLGNPLLLAYLKTKQTAYATAFLQGNFAGDVSANIDPVTVTMRTIDQQAKFQMLSELISECEQAAVRMDELQAAAHEESSSDSTSTQPLGF